MNTHKVTQIQIGNGTGALPTGATTIAPASINAIGIYGNDMLALTAGDTISTAGKASLIVFNKLANGDLKKSMEIRGTNVTAYKGQSYAAAKRKVHAVGYNRNTSTGTIEVNNSTIYKAVVRFTNDKQMYSERPEVLSATFTSAPTATQSNVADQLVNAINNSAFGTGLNRQIIAVKVGDGTGAYGVTAATNFGVEVWGLDIAQTETNYMFNQVNFQVFVDDSTGFGSTTTSVEIQGVDPGVGTYNLIYNQERYDLQYEGVLNRRLWPIPVQSYLASNNYFNSGAIAPTANVTTGQDKVTFSASVATATTNILAGDKVLIDGVAYEIKYMASTTVGYLTTPATTTNATAAVIKRFQYDVYSIEFTDLVTTPGVNIGAFAKKLLLIATPAIDAAGAVNSLSTEGAAIKAILNPWMTSTPLAPTTLAL